jgi:hypothetical protein
MVSLTCETTREGGVTLVTARVTNADRRRRVRLEHDAAGAVWPPRTEGVPAAGWDGPTFECVLDAAETRALGYATPAAVEDPLVVAGTEPVDSETGFETHESVPDVPDGPTGVVRALGTPVPPRDAVPEPDVPTDPEPRPDGIATGEGDGVDDSSPFVGFGRVDAGAPVDGTSATDDEAAADSGSDSAPDRNRGEDTAEAAAGEGGSTRATVLDADADAVDAWLDAAESRIATMEGLSETTSVDTAARAVRELGGLDGVRTATETTAEADRLRWVAERAAALADRAEAADLPVETLERFP